MSEEAQVTPVQKEDQKVRLLKLKQGKIKLEPEDWTAARESLEEKGCHFYPRREFDLPEVDSKRTESLFGDYADMATDSIALSQKYLSYQAIKAPSRETVHAANHGFRRSLDANARYVYGFNKFRTGRMTQALRPIALMADWVNDEELSEKWGTKAAEFDAAIQKDRDPNTGEKIITANDPRNKVSVARTEENKTGYQTLPEGQKQSLVQIEEGDKEAIYPISQFDFMTDEQQLDFVQAIDDFIVEVTRDLSSQL